MMDLIVVQCCIECEGQSFVYGCMTLFMVKEMPRTSVIWGRCLCRRMCVFEKEDVESVCNRVPRQKRQGIWSVSMCCTPPVSVSASLATCMYGTHLQLPLHVR